MDGHCKPTLWWAPIPSTTATLIPAGAVRGIELQHTSIVRSSQLHATAIFVHQPTGVCEFVDRAIPPVERWGFKFRDGIISKAISIGQNQNGANWFQITRKISESLPRARTGPPKKADSSSGKIWRIWGECSGQVVYKYMTQHIPT